jgi:hypothetical protein
MQNVEDNALSALLGAEALAAKIKTKGVPATVKTKIRGDLKPTRMDEDEEEQMRRQQGIDRNMRWRGRELLEGVGSPSPTSPSRSPGPRKGNSKGTS